MNMKTLKPIYAIVAILVASSTIAFSMAVDGEDTTNPNEDRYEQKVEKLQERKEELEQNRLEWNERKDEFAERRCEVLEKRVDLAIDRYTNNNSRYTEVFENLVEKLTAFADWSEDAGQDVTALRADIETLKTKIDVIYTAYGEYIQELSDSKSLACGQSEGEYKVALKTALQSHLAVKKMIIETRSFYQNEIKPDLKMLREEHRNALREQRIEDTN